MKKKIVCKVYLKSGKVIKTKARYSKADYRKAIQAIAEIQSNLGTMIGCFHIGNAYFSYTDVSAICRK